jgi:hypothetical protein
MKGRFRDPKATRVGSRAVVVEVFSLMLLCTRVKCWMRSVWNQRAFCTEGYLSGNLRQVPRVARAPGNAACSQLRNAGLPYHYTILSRSDASGE